MGGGESPLLFIIEYDKVQKILLVHIVYTNPIPGISNENPRQKFKSPFFKSKLLL